MTVLFSFLWDCVPPLISVVGFSIYVLTNHELTIPVAFASIAIFGMLMMYVHLNSSIRLYLTFRSGH